MDERQLDASPRLRWEDLKPLTPELLAELKQLREESRHLDVDPRDSTELLREFREYVAR